MGKIKLLSFENMSKRVQNLPDSLVGTWLTCGIFKSIWDCENC